MKGTVPTKLKDWDDDATKNPFWGDIHDADRTKMAEAAYQDLINRGIAKEVARSVLSPVVYSRLYVTGSCRSWIHYIGVRDDEGVAQYEHCELARTCKSVFADVFPTVYNSLDWGYNKGVDETERLKKELIELQAEIAVLKAQKE